MERKQHAGMSARTFWRGVLWIVLLWVVATLALAANTAWMELHPPAASPAPAATPRADTTGQAINCHRHAPPTPSPWLAVARTDAERYGIDVRTFEWKIWQESGFNPNVHDSPAGAIGIAQFEPATAQGMGIDPRNPRQALDASARLDAQHLRQYAAQARQLATHYGGNGARYVWGLALSAYNAGTGRTSWAWNQAYAEAHPLAHERPLGLAEAVGGGNTGLRPGYSWLCAVREEQAMALVHSCPKCEQPLAARARCPLCGWQPELTPPVTPLLADGLVVTLRWKLVAGVPVGEPVETLPLQDWLQRHASSSGAGDGGAPPRTGH